MRIRKTVLVYCALCQFFSCAAAADPLAAPALYALAESDRKNGHYLEALSFYRDVLQNSRPEEIPADLYMTMGDLYAGYLESYEQALACYRKQLELFPAHCSAPDAHLRIARMLYLQGQTQPARARCQLLRSLFPDYAQKEPATEELRLMEKADAKPAASAVSAERPLPFYIRVLLQDDTAPAEIAAPGGLQVYTDGQAPVCAIPDGRSIVVRPEKNRIVIDNHGTLLLSLRIEAAAGTGIQVHGQIYRGSLRAYLREGRMMLVNHLPLEEYLYGVLAKEVPASWPQAALQALAIAARTYALYNILKKNTEPFDVFATTASQAYGGLASEKGPCRQAVDETRGLVLSFDRKLALALYHANSGGMIETPEDIWGWPAPYLAAKPDSFSRDTKNSQWERTLAAEDIAGCLRRAGLALPEPGTIKPLQRDRSGRITRLALQADIRTVYLSGNSFRLLAGPGRIKSANFSVERNSQSFIFSGSGYGHGVGMSQWGACAMARQGHSAEQILQWYYPGTNIVPVRYQNR